MFRGDLLLYGGSVVLSCTTSRDVLGPTLEYSEIFDGDSDSTGRPPLGDSVKKF